MLSPKCAFRELLNLMLVFRLILDTDTNMFVVIWAVEDVSVNVVERGWEWMNVYRIWELYNFGRLGATVAETNTRGEFPSLHAEEILVD